MGADLRLLPVGTSSFPSLRADGKAYVDKTEMICRLAAQDGRFFLARPRRFGKSLLISTFWSLFKFGLRDFQGLKIAPLWRDQCYRVVRLDFSELGRDCGVEFEHAFSSVLEAGFGEAGFVRSGTRDVVRQLSDWLRAQPPRSVVVLIDAHDAPLTACLDDPARYEAAQGALAAFYAAMKSNDDCLRFLFVAGMTKAGPLFSSLNNLTDLSLDAACGTLLGFTTSEIEACFPSHLSHAAAQLGLTHAALIAKLQAHFGGFCFDQRAKTQVFSPGAVLKFLDAPSEGFRQEHSESILEPSGLTNYLRMHAKQVFSDDEAPFSDCAVPISTLRAASSEEEPDPLVLLTQAGCLTIRAVGADGWAKLGCPNLEAALAMRRLARSS